MEKTDRRFLVSTTVGEFATELARFLEIARLAPGAVLPHLPTLIRTPLNVASGFFKIIKTLIISLDMKNHKVLDPFYK